jgi:hypothetical protein
LFCFPAPRNVLNWSVLSTAQLDEPGSKEAILQQEHKTQPTFSFGLDKLQQQLPKYEEWGTDAE